MIISEIQSEIGHCSCDSAKFKAPADFSHHAILCMTLSLIYVFFQKCSNLCKKYLGFLRMFNFTQLITEATRVTSNSSTLIDHILSNSCEKGLLALD